MEGTQVSPYITFLLHTSYGLCSNSHQFSEYFFKVFFLPISYLQNYTDFLTIVLVSQLVIFLFSYNANLVQSSSMYYFSPLPWPRDMVEVGRGFSSPGLYPPAWPLCHLLGPAFAPCISCHRSRIKTQGPPPLLYVCYHCEGSPSSSSTQKRSFSVFSYHIILLSLTNLSLHHNSSCACLFIPCANSE